MSPSLPESRDSCMVVKHTFIDIVEEGLSSPSDTRFQRFRCHSDPGLYDPDDGSSGLKGAEKQEPEDVPGTVDFELAGLSDADTDAEAHTQEPLPCYSQLSNGAPSSSGSVCLDRPDMPAVGTPQAEGPSGQAGWQDVASLLRENARLALENKLLRENARLASENATLQAGSMQAYAMDHSEGLSCMSMNWMEEAMPMAHAQQACAPPTVAPGTWVVPMGYHAGHQVICAQAPAMPRGSRGCGGDASASEATEASASRRRRRQAAAAKPSPTSDEPLQDDDQRTTVMLRNLPNNYTREMILAMLDSEGFERLYDFIYLPMDFKTQACLGYAFVNLVDPEVVPKFWNKFDGYSNWVLPSKKICGVTWSGPHQGRDAHVDRYRNSPVMHPSVPEAYKPLVFENGQRVPFPQPSKTPRAPRTRNYACAPGGNKSHWTTST